MAFKETLRNPTEKNTYFRILWTWEDGVSLLGPRIYAAYISWWFKFHDYYPSREEEINSTLEAFVQAEMIPIAIEICSGTLSPEDRQPTKEEIAQFLLPTGDQS